ncbi:MAG TPA: hypothetical protein PLG33_00790 [Prolixibacteraceae bacterium]|nr:hypothetical protein [Prolixibacteraceae bacterium]HPR84551.1 hypothetical protein [Prolixibacteraceae bacterium]
MSSSTDYNELLPIFAEMNSADVLTPNIPIDVFVQEAENLYHWCVDDQNALTRVGLNWNMVTSLPTRAGACREAQSLWVKEHNTRKLAEQAWKKEAPAAFDLRDQLVHDFRFAFRKFDNLSARVEEIAQGDTSSDMVQDLNDLATLGRANGDLLGTIGFDFSLIDKAATLSDRMGDLLGATNGERKEDSEALLIRDKAYTYLKQAVDEIRECGKFAFWRTPERLKGYSSEHWQKAYAARIKAEAAKDEAKA